MFNFGAVVLAFVPNFSGEVPPLYPEICNAALDKVRRKNAFGVLHIISAFLLECVATWCFYDSIMLLNDAQNTFEKKRILEILHELVSFKIFSVVIFCPARSKDGYFINSSSHFLERKHLSYQNTSCLGPIHT